MMGNDDVFKEALERLDILTNELNRIKRAVISVNNGVPFNEAFELEVFLEEKQFEKKCRKYLTTMMEQLLKMKYCINTRNHRQWENTIKRSRRDVMDEVEWKSKRRDANLYKFITSNMQDFYEAAISYYKDAAAEYSDLRDGIEMIPEEVPWTLEELMDQDINSILNKLP